MKIRFFPGVLLAMTMAVSGCGHLDVSAPQSEDRVLNGHVVYDLESALPADAVITVRVVDASNPALPYNVLGETTLTHPSAPPVPFRVEYRATDEQLMRQVMLDVRISFGGRMRYHTVTGHPITLGNVSDTHVIRVDPAG